MNKTSFVQYIAAYSSVMGRDKKTRIFEWSTDDWRNTFSGNSRMDSIVASSSFKNSMPTALFQINVKHCFLLRFF